MYILRLGSARGTEKGSGIATCPEPLRGIAWVCPKRTKPLCFQCFWVSIFFGVGWGSFFSLKGVGVFKILSFFLVVYVLFRCLGAMRI